MKHIFKTSKEPFARYFLVGKSDLEFPHREREESDRIDGALGRHMDRTQRPEFRRYCHIRYRGISRKSGKVPENESREG